MLNHRARLAMFFSSYVPLAAIFFALYVGKENEVAILAFAAALLGGAGICWILRVAKSQTESITRTIVDYREPGDEVMGYVASR
jgi:hypothetical protein